MFKLPKLPSPEASVSELADFAELLCWINGRASGREVVSYLGQIDDNKINDGCDDIENRLTDMLEDVFDEIDRRRKICRSSYPFILELSGAVLKNPARRLIKPKQVVYLYLLLSTRLDMAQNKVYAGIDGTPLLEHISAHALRIYLGKNRAKSIVFAALDGRRFVDKVTNLCEMLQEGLGFENKYDLPNYAKDDKLDIVAWVPFADSFPGQLILFGQCKTGTNWKDSKAELQPVDFIDKWIRRPFIAPPVRTFCVSESIDSSIWTDRCKGAGLLLDRCRLVEHSTGLDLGILEQIQEWTLQAGKSLESEWL